MKITCSQCGKTFELTQNEMNFYNSKGLDYQNGVNPAVIKTAENILWLILKRSLKI